MRKTVDWNRIDPLIRQYLPSYTIVEFTSKFAQETIPRTIGQRAKKLGVVPAAKTLTQQNKDQLSKETSKYQPSDEIDLYLTQNNGKVSIPTMAIALKWSSYAIRKRLCELGLPIVRKVNKTLGYSAPKSNRINWDENLLRKHLPNHTIIGFQRKFMPRVSVKAISQKAKKLGISHKLYKPTNGHKSLISKNIQKYDFTLEVDKFLLKNAPKMSIKELAKLTNINKTVIWKRFNELGYIHQNADIKTKHQRRTKEAITDEIRERLSKLSIKQWQDPKYRKKMQTIYRNPEFREKMAVIRSQQPRVSSIEKILYSILNDLDIKYIPQKPIGFYSFDCFIPSHNILIECQGDYWHSFPKAIRNDKAKATYIERYFPQYQLKCLWEHEFYAKDRITGLIKYWLGLDTPELVDFSFDEVEIRKIKHPDVKLLLSKYHYLPNAGNGGIVYGACLKDELIACCVFSPPTRKEIATRLGFQPKEIRELSRFCIHPFYQKKNFGSWFISRCLKQLKNYKLVVSFCDTTYNHDGALYKACNFKLDGKTRPDYWYVDKDGYVMHKKTLYQRAVSMKTKEREYAEKNNYTKVWGKEKLRFIKEFQK